MSEHNASRKPVMLLTGRAGEATSGPWNAYGDTPRQRELQSVLDDPNVEYVEVHLKDGASLRYERIPG